jgi:amidohydrolase
MQTDFWADLANTKSFPTDVQQIWQELASRKDPTQKKDFIVQESSKLTAGTLAITDTCLVITLKFLQPGQKIGFFSSLLTNKKTADLKNAFFLALLQLLAAKNGNLTGEIKFIFQFADFSLRKLPAGLQGAAGIYSFFLTPAKISGQILLSAGAIRAAQEHFLITVQGKGGHGSAPEKSIDATLTAAYIAQELQSIVSRNKSPLKQAALCVTSFKAGEGADNIITEKAYLRGTILALSAEENTLFQKRLTKIAQKTAESQQASSSVTITRAASLLVNQASQTKLLQKIFQKYLTQTTIRAIVPSLETEQVATVLTEVSGAVFGFSTDKINDFQQTRLWLQAHLAIITYFLAKK